MVHLSDATTRQALREAVRADVMTRLDEIADRLECRVDASERLEDLEILVAESLAEAARVVADEFAVRIREARPRQA